MSAQIRVTWPSGGLARFKNLINDPTRQRALLLHYTGEETHDIFDTLIDTVASEDENALGEAVAALTAHLVPKRNREYVVYKFRQAKQEKGEDITAFYIRLKQLPRTCEFADSDKEIKSQIVQNCESSRLRRKALSDPEMTLVKLIDTARVM